MATSKLVIVGGATLFQSIVHIFISGLALLQYQCQIDWLDWSATTAFMKILYFHNPTCSESVNIGRHISELPNQAALYLREVPFTTHRSVRIASAYMVLGVLWFITSILLIVGVRRNPSGSCAMRSMMTPWIAVTAVSLFLDAAGAIMFLPDAWRTNTMTNLASYIGANASGFGGQEVEGTWVAAVIMGTLCGRALVGWLVHMVCFVSALSKVSGRRKKNDSEDIEMMPRERIPSGTLEETTAVPPPPPPPIPNGREVRPRPPPSPQPVRRAATTDSIDHQQPPPVRTMRHVAASNPIAGGGAEDSPRIHFPTSLLSIPQQLEQALADNNRPWQQSAALAAAAGAAGHAEAAPRERDARRPSAVSSHTQTMTDLEGLPATTSAGGPMSSQMAWSYYHFGSPSHRMRDQLPPDEELPPVPVPDYTLRPKKFFTSLFRGGSSASASTTASALRLHGATETQASTSTPNWRSNDVLY